MARYNVEFVEQRYNGAGQWTSVFLVCTLEDDGSEQEVPNQFWVGVDNEWLCVYDTPINPFDYMLIKDDEAVVPVDSYELQYCTVEYVMEQKSEFAYVDYSDPLVFMDEDLEDIDDKNNLYLACWYRWKFEMNKQGYC